MKCSKCSSGGIGFTKETIRGKKKKVYYCLGCYNLYGKYGIKGTINKFNITVTKGGNLNRLVKKAPSKPSLTSLDKKALSLWSLVVKKRANFMCEYPFCSKNNYLNSHHLVSRVNRATRHDLDNGMCLCSGHHTLLKESAHKDPFFKDVIMEYGIRTKEFFDTLRIKANQICIMSPEKLQTIILDLEDMERKYQ